MSDSLVNKLKSISTSTIESKLTESLKDLIQKDIHVEINEIKYGDVFEHTKISLEISSVVDETTFDLN